MASPTYNVSSDCSSSNCSSTFPPVLCFNQRDNSAWDTPWVAPFLTCNHSVIVQWTEYPNTSIQRNPIELETIANFVSAVVYGMVLSLYIICLLALSEGRKKYSTRRKWFLRVYITLMLLLSTASLIGDIIVSMYDIFYTLNTSPDFLQISLNDVQANVFIPLTVFPFAIWGADVLMMWRCVALYQGTSRILRVVILSVLVALFLLSSALCLMGFLSFRVKMAIFLFNTGPIFGQQWIFVVILGSTVINIFLSALIVLRIRYHQSYIRKTLGRAHGSLYNRIVVMCVESCSLIAVVELVYLILTYQIVELGYPTQFPFFLLPHICAISPLLIVYRVARGTETTTTFNATDAVNGRIGRVEQQIQFESPISTHAS